MATTDGTAPGALTPGTFNQLMARVDGFVATASEALPDGFRDQDVRDVMLDQLATLAMLRDLAKSDKLRDGITASLEVDDERRGWMSTIPEDAMAVALDGNDGVLSPALIATGLFDKYVDLPARQRRTLLAAMQLPNVGQLGQPIEAFPSMLKEIVQLRRRSPDIADDAIALWLLESFTRVAGAVPAQDYRAGSEIATEGYVSNYLKLCSVADGIEASTTDADCILILNEYLYGAAGTAPKDRLDTLCQKMAVTLNAPDPSFTANFRRDLAEKMTPAELAQAEAFFSMTGFGERAVLPRQLPQLIRNLAGAQPTPDRLAQAAAAGVRLALPFMESAAAVIDGDVVQPYQVDLMEIANACKVGLPANDDAFVASVVTAHTLQNFGGRHGVVRAL